MSTSLFIVLPVSFSFCVVDDKKILNGHLHGVRGGALLLFQIYCRIFFPSCVFSWERFYLPNDVLMTIDT